MRHLIAVAAIGTATLGGVALGSPQCDEDQVHTVDGCVAFDDLEVYLGVQIHELRACDAGAFFVTTEEAHREC